MIALVHIRAHTERSPERHVALIKQSKNRFQIVGTKTLYTDCSTFSARKLDVKRLITAHVISRTWI